MQNALKPEYLKLMKTFLVHNNVMVFHLMMQVKIEHVSSFKVEGDEGSLSYIETK